METAQDKLEAGDFGIYAIYDKKEKDTSLIYIGECYWQDFGKRLRQHKNEWLHRVKGRLYVCFGTVMLPEGKRISHQRILDVEGALIHFYRPPCNTVGKKGYSGRDILIFNTGKSIALDPIVSHDTELLSLLQKALK